MQVHKDAYKYTPVYVCLLKSYIYLYKGIYIVHTLYRHCSAKPIAPCLFLLPDIAGAQSKTSETAFPSKIPLQALLTSHLHVGFSYQTMFSRYLPPRQIYQTKQRMDCKGFLLALRHS